MDRREMLKVSAAALASGPFLNRTAKAADVIRIEFTLFSAFYSPLVAAIAGGFLAAEGLTPVYTVSAPGRSALASLDDGGAHVVQTAPSQAFNALEKGQIPSAVHFAQINEKDGFFLAARDADPDFSWRKLTGKKVLVTPGVQPTTMFKYACFKAGIDIGDVQIVDAGPAEAMVAAFRRGEGDYIHLQGPGPQQLEHDGVGHIVTALADVVGPCAFSSLAAKRDWLETDRARAFMRAYRKARAWLIATDAADVARTEADFFKGTDPAVLTRTIAAYQGLGTWSPHVEITRPAFEATLDIFQHAGLISRRYAYEDVVAPPPA
ncbi:MAG: ABC transporter substrate-binding protein [Azospirillaceae bacterium]|nr:ABC transporter substrate-binding protein [Azospirillaceae bacterium]